MYSGWSAIAWLVSGISSCGGRHRPEQHRSPVRDRVHVRRLRRRDPDLSERVTAQHRLGPRHAGRFEHRGLAAHRRRIGRSDRRRLRCCTGSRERCSATSCPTASPRPNATRRSRETFAMLQDQAPMLIVFGRFVPGVRFVVGATMGLTRYPYPRFLLWDAVGGVAWAAFACLSSALVSTAIGDQPLLSLVVSDPSSRRRSSRSSTTAEARLGSVEGRGHNRSRRARTRRGLRGDDIARLNDLQGPGPGKSFKSRDVNPRFDRGEMAGTAPVGHSLTASSPRRRSVSGTKEFEDNRWW